ncbi:uncharacterized protein [Acropora muricata]|uniref:uncharacterized protein n=1 Tax=Acropora muricata TaxID=159855 RepID=UPI0034E4A456
MAANPPVMGCPRRPERIRRLKLRESTYNLWNQRKEALGIHGITNSEFAEILLHQNVSTRQHRERSPGYNSSGTQRQGRRQLFLQSSPAESSCRPAVIPISPVSDATPSVSDSSRLEVDVTGDVTPNAEEELQPGHLTLTGNMKTLNPWFSSVEGNPIPQVVNEDDSTSDVASVSLSSDSDEVQSVADSVSSDSEVNRSEEEWIQDSIQEEQTGPLSPSESATLTALELEPDSEPDPNSSVSETQSHPEASGVSSSSHPEFGPMTFDQYKNDMKERVSCGIQGLILPGQDMQKYLDFFNADRVIVEVDKIFQLFEGQCVEIGCTGQRKVVDRKVEGGVLLVTYTCSQGHNAVWSSSSVLCEKRGQKIYVSTVLLASSVLVSGNNFEKVSLLARSMNLQYVSSTTFSRIQSLYSLPSIRELWNKMKEIIWKVFENDLLVVCGDGRMDSPGFSAKYCVYTMMEHYLNVIVDLEVVGKREAGGTSTLMEKIGCKRLLERMMNRLKLGELVTDASRVIMKMVRELKEANCTVLANLFHSLDIWHKSIKLTAKISAAGKIKGCEQLLQWVEPVRNHFWHCAETCGGEVEILKDKWLGILHHVCGEHEWDGDTCSHGPLTEVESTKEYLGMNSKAVKELRKIILDREWLKSLEFYVQFRHTSNLENFNSMLLKYAPKRIAFVYEVFTGRILLAALDHNFHMFRKNLEGQFKKKYSKRSGNWRVEPVKEPKQYPHLPLLQADIMRRRAEDRAGITRHIEVSPTNPVHLAPTIAMKAAPSTEELVKTKLSRFEKRKQPE